MTRGNSHEKDNNKSLCKHTYGKKICFGNFMPHTYDDNVRQLGELEWKKSLFLYFFMEYEAATSILRINK